MSFIDNIQTNQVYFLWNLLIEGEMMSHMLNHGTHSFECSSIYLTISLVLIHF